MKKWFWRAVRIRAALAFALALMAAGLLGCGNREAGDMNAAGGSNTASDTNVAGGSNTADDTSGDRLQVVCTIFPEYDWTKEILGELADEVDLTLLLKNGSDLHSYQPTVWDMVKISDADLFIYVGGESDFWVADALANGKNPDQKVLNLMEILENERKEEEHVEGMQGGHEHEHGNEVEYDEHVWLSLRNAQIVCGAITEALRDLDEEHEDIYVRNRDAYLEKLDALDQEYIQVTEQAEEPVLLFGDRFPFRYLTEDYGLSYYAAFSGCSAETEASFEVITFLAGKADELSAPAILTIDGSDGKIARTIADNTRSSRPTVLMLDSMQSVSETDIENGENYLSIMGKNLEVLREALPGAGR